MDQLLALFPLHSAAELQGHLARANGVLELAIDTLLAGPQECTTTNSSSSDNNNNHNNNNNNNSVYQSASIREGKLGTIDLTRSESGKSSGQGRAVVFDLTTDSSDEGDGAQDMSFDLPSTSAGPSIYPAFSSAAARDEGDGAQYMSFDLPSSSAGSSVYPPPSSVAVRDAVLPDNNGANGGVNKGVDFVAALASFEDFHAEQQRLIEEQRRLELEERLRRAVEAIELEQRIRLLCSNFITLAQDMFKDISVDFLEDLMRRTIPMLSSMEELADACIQAITNMKDAYPRRAKRKRSIDDVGNGHRGKRADESDEDASNSEDEADAGASSSNTQTYAPSQTQTQNQNQTRPHRDYMDCSFRMMGAYEACCLNQLYQDFPKISSGTIKNCMRKHRNHYIPTFEYITNLWADLETAPGRTTESSTEVFMVELQTPRKEKPRRGKQILDPEFQAELDWLKARTAKEMAEIEALEQEEKNTAYYKERNELIECGCCFDEVAPNRVAQCEDGHLFCMECSRRGAEVEIGYQRTVLKCMSAGCKSAFADSEAIKFLPSAVFKGLLRARQQQELKMAGLDSLVECPFCPYAAVMENENDKEFRCQARRCRKISCRLCKQLTHIPLSCEEHRKEQEKNSVLSAQHRVEEQMSQALIRECPKCKSRFFKTEGCNKMTCPECHTKMCYVCKKEIKDYSHFDQTPANSAPRNRNLCRLWENTIQRNEAEVKAAAQRSMQELEAQEPSLVAHVRIDIPK
ncbi:hypothetical protein KVV02_008312 [Mortierella alpina]|uniref:RING-type domain-containing protein n=1 Tax=Mortierella alpina TaxID=64518 RepID=A0A9P8A464_MORAP|nr:hypothetical protein KVV02_008312 [Mortierella alpina]